MNDDNPEIRALRPLWMLATGVVAGAVAATCVSPPGHGALPWLLCAAGLAILLVALHRPRVWVLWLIAGLALAGGRGLQVGRHHAELERRLAAHAETSLRVRASILEGWTSSRWGWRTRVRVTAASQHDQTLRLPRRCRLEVRGRARPDRLPVPGSRIEALASVRGEPRRPLLVVSSPTLIEILGQPRGLPMLRDRGARGLLDAGGTDVRRIRAAELAAALALGRRDLLPEDRRDGWRRSGLAHLLAVSGLHVGLVAAVVWLLAQAANAPPRTARIAVLVALPTYALLAGASPSAVRAAVMGMIYIGARLLGRALIPMAAVLLTGIVMLLGTPDLVIDVGFQLTILITATLVRWVPPLVERIPGPRRLVGALAVPVVAQIAAAPIVAWHFRTAVPGAVAANLLVPLLLAPTLIASLTAAAISPLSPTIGGWCLDGVALCERALWLSGSAGRSVQLVLPTLPVLAVALLAACGWLALRPGRRAARAGVVGWLATSVALAAWWWLRPPPDPPRVEMLPVADGLSALVIDTGGALLADGGRWTDEASQQITDRGVGRLSAVMATHSDEDHISGLERVLGTRRVDALVVPVWMLSEPAAVPLLRVARRQRARIVPAARGLGLRLGSTLIEVLWPPALDPPTAENERSLVARLRTSAGSVLVTSDIGSSTEVWLARAGSLACRVLIAPHHGSRGSTSSALLAAADPEVVLIPAGPRNIHNHPHPEVLKRLEARELRYRFPARDGLCGARFADGEWEPFP